MMQSNPPAIQQPTKPRTSQRVTSSWGAMHYSVSKSQRSQATLINEIVQRISAANAGLISRTSAFWDSPVQGRFLGAMRELPRFLSHQAWLPVLIPVGSKTASGNNSDVTDLDANEELTPSEERLQVQINYQLAESWLSEALGPLTLRHKVPSTQSTPQAMQGLSPFEWFLIEQWVTEWKAFATGDPPKTKASEPSQPTTSTHPWLHVDSERPAQGSKLWLVWVFPLLHNSEQPGYVTTQVPVAWLLPPEPAKKPKASTEDTAPTPEPFELPDDLFADLWYPVQLSAGSTRLTMADLGLLETGDVLVLEQSSSDSLWWRPPSLASSILSNHSDIPLSTEYTAREASSGTTPDDDAWTLVRVAGLPVPKLPQPVITADNETSTTDQSFTTQSQGSSPMAASQHQSPPMQLTRSLWDDLPVDVRAEFLPVKLPMSQVKQMSDGLVIEVGDWIRTPMRLHVDGKTLAHGELVMVGDKLGVRITTVTGQEPTPNTVLISEQTPEKAANTDTQEPDMGMSSGMPMATTPEAPVASDSNAPSEKPPEGEADMDEALSSLFDDDFDNDDDEEDW